MERTGDGVTERSGEIAERKQRVEDAIEEAKREVSLFVADLYHRGRVEVIPRTSGKITIAGGWELERHAELGRWELFTFEAKDSVLQWHSYSSDAVIIPFDGRLYYREKKPNPVEKSADQMSSLYVPADVVFQLVPIGVVHGVKLFSPPISAET